MNLSLMDWPLPPSFSPLVKIIREKYEIFLKNYLHIMKQMLKYTDHLAVIKKLC